MKAKSTAAPAAQSIDMTLVNSGAEVFTFTSAHKPVPYPTSAAIYYMRPMEPHEWREWNELLGATELEYDPKTQEILRLADGTPIRKPSLRDEQCVGFALRFIDRVENLRVNDMLVSDPRDPMLQKVLWCRGESKPLEVSLDSNGNVISNSALKKGGVEVARKETRYLIEERWVWIIREAHNLFVKANESRKESMGN